MPSGQGVALTGGDLVYFTVDGSDPRLPGGNISAAATLWTGDLLVTEDLTLRARAYRDGLWSALAEVAYTVQ